MNTGSKPGIIIRQWDHGNAYQFLRIDRCVSLKFRNEKVYYTELSSTLRIRLDNGNEVWAPEPVLEFYVSAV